MTTDLQDGKRGMGFRFASHLRICELKMRVNYTFQELRVTSGEERAEKGNPKTPRREGSGGNEKDRVPEGHRAGVRGSAGRGRSAAGRAGLCERREAGIWQRLERLAVQIVFGGVFVFSVLWGSASFCSATGLVFRRN